MRYLNEEEYFLASRFLFLSMAILVIRQDACHIQNGNYKIKELYIDLLKSMEKHAVTERRELRKQMEQRKLKVISLEKSDSFSSFLFICDKREEKKNYFNPAIRKKVEMILRELMQKALQHDQRGPETHTKSASPVNIGNGQFVEPDS